MFSEIQIQKVASSIWKACTRKKTKNADSSHLARVLRLIDLIFLGTGATLGLGVYVLAGSVAKTFAGPATCLSFLLGSIIALLGGLCFAEFAARVPRTGYAYAYCYAGVGEFIAFVVGWYYVLASMLGSAGVASGMSSYINILVDEKIETTLLEYCPINVPHLSPFPDLLALGIILLIGCLLSVGVKESVTFNNGCTILNMITIVVTIVACLVKADGKNWRISPEDIPAKYKNEAGEGGFLPFGVAGIIAGTPNCFFGLTGFDAPAACSDESRNPKRNIPIAILTSLLIAFTVYFTISTVLTLAWPYYLQHVEAPFPYVFEQFGWIWVKWIVAIGAIFALLSSLFGSMYQLPRLVYAMANDGLIFKKLAKVHRITQTPLIATSLAGAITGVMATILNVDKLMDLMTIGALFTYVVVAASVLVLRYENSGKDEDLEKEVGEVNTTIFETIINLKNVKIPNRTSSKITNLTVTGFIVIAIFFCLIVDERFNFSTDASYYVPMAITLFGMLLLTGIIYRQPQSTSEISFKVPFVPFIPLLTIICNLFLMMQLSTFVWSGFLIWIGIGLLVYFFYGIKHSTLNISEWESSKL